MKMSKTIIIYFSFWCLFILSACNYAPAQAVSGISQRCQTPYQKIYQSIIAGASGDLIYTPCPTRSSIFTGNVDFSGATVTGIISGGTTNRIPYYNSTTSIAPASWLQVSNNNLNIVNPSGSFNALFTTGNSGAIALGDTTTPNAGLLLDRANNNVKLSNAGRTILSAPSATSLALGDALTVGGGTKLTITDTSGFVFAQTNNLANLNLTSVWNYNVQKTNTSTVGSVTINKPFGEIIMASGTLSTVVLNNIIASDSLVFVTGQQADASCKNFHVGSKSGGGFEIIADVACTLDTKVAFWIVN